MHVQKQKDWTRVEATWECNPSSIIVYNKTRTIIKVKIIITSSISRDAEILEGDVYLAWLHLEPILYF